MSSAYRLHPESRYSSPPKLHHKLGLALAFIAFGSIAGAGGIVLHMAGNELASSGSPVMAAAALKPAAAHATSPAAPPPPTVSAPKAPPSNPMQTAPVAAMIAAAPAAPEPVAAAEAEPVMSAATEPRRRWLLPTSRRTKRAARAGASAAGTTPMRGARVRITDVGAAIIGGRPGDVAVVVARMSEAKSGASSQTWPDRRRIDARSASRYRASQLCAGSTQVGCTRLARA